MQSLNSKDVAEMLGKRHDNFMRELRKYVVTLGEAAPEYFVERGLDKQRGHTFEITLKGCELIAGRIVGAKNAEFKAKYREAFAADLEPVEKCTPQETHGCTHQEIYGYSTEEAAEILGCSRRTVQRMIQRGDLTTQEVTVLVPTVKSLIIPEELDRYQKERAAV